MQVNGAVVVGLGAVGGGHRELDWAAREAELRDRPLGIVRAAELTHMLAPWETPIDRDLYQQLLTLERRRVDSAREHVARAHPGVHVECLTPDSTAHKALTELSRYADLVVVGSHGRGALGSIVLGSVSSYVATAAHCPVVVVREWHADAGDVVAGVDGSAASQDVLEFAFDHASRHDRNLSAVLCWQGDLLATANLLSEPPTSDRAQRWLSEALAGWCSKYPDVPVRAEVVRDAPVPALVTAAATAELLVVGTHSRIGVAGSLLGSVSQGVLHHATCPVAVVHHARHHHTDWTTS